MEKYTAKYNWPLIGNSHITDFLDISITNKSISEAYIFNGPDNLGKTAVAINFAKILLCDNKNNSTNLPCGICKSCKLFFNNNKIIKAHSDFFLLKKNKDKKNIAVEQIRKFIQFLSTSSFLNSYKIGIIKNAENMNLQSSNALLKTLEEPKKNAIIILTTNNIELLPKTIVSRCQILEFKQVKTDIIYDYLIKNHNAKRSEAKTYSRICLGRPALAIKFLEDKDFLNFHNNKAEMFINFFNQDISERFSIIEKSFDKKMQTQEVVNITEKTIKIWLGITRDFLLLKYGFFNIIQNQMHEQKIEQIKNNLSINKILLIINSLLISQKYLHANVNPKLVLENIAVEI